MENIELITPHRSLSTGQEINQITESQENFEVIDSFGTIKFSNSRKAQVKQNKTVQLYQF